MSAGVRPRRLTIVALCTLVVMIAGCGGPTQQGQSAAQREPEQGEPEQRTPGADGVTPAFTRLPTSDVAGLDPTRRRIVESARQEFEAASPGAKYFGDIPEPWCADFISWVMRDAGIPLKNPNSGSWRIPGTRTLADYYRTQVRFAAPRSGYQPKAGDVLIYDKNSPFGQHASIVIAAEPGAAVTVGGNEWNEIRVRRIAYDRVAGLVGFGRPGAVPR
jgi:hypothetical protein